MFKVCCRCKINKNWSQFRPRGKSVTSWCKQCYLDYKKSKRQPRIKKEKPSKIIKTCKICLIELNCKNRTGICKPCYKPIKKQKIIESNITLKTKKCSKCGEIKNIDCFYYDKNSIYKKSYRCITCAKESKTNDKYRARARELYHAKETTKINNKRKYANMISEKPWLRLRFAISTAIRNALIKNNSSKNGKSIFDKLSYTITELKNHIESQFEPWMNWGNYGLCDLTRKTWQIDHIVPQSKLPYKSMDDENFRKCWALSNLRPLDSFENNRKGNKC